MTLLSRRSTTLQVPLELYSEPRTSVDVSAFGKGEVAETSEMTLAKADHPLAAAAKEIVRNVAPREFVFLSLSSAAPTAPLISVKSN